MFITKNTTVIHTDDEIIEICKSLNKDAKFKKNIEPEKDVSVLIIGFPYDLESLEKVVKESRITVVLENNLEYLNVLLNLNKNYSYKFRYILDTTKTYLELFKNNL